MFEMGSQAICMACATMTIIFARFPYLFFFLLVVNFDYLFLTGQDVSAASWNNSSQFGRLLSYVGSLVLVLSYFFLFVKELLSFSIKY